MKKWLVLLGIALAMGCTSRSINPGFKIIGNIFGLNNSKVFLYRYVNENWEPVDTVEAHKGAFMFLGRVEIPEMYKIKINDTLPFISVFVENDEINLVASLDSLNRYKIAGSKSHEEYERFWGKQEVYSQRIDSLEHAKLIAANKNDERKILSIDGKIEKVWKSEIESMRNHVLQNNSSVVSAYIAWSRLANCSDISQLETINKSFDSSINNSVYVGLLKNYTDKLKKVELGQPAIDFSMATPEGNKLKLSSLYGKYVLIDFWASWCPPCRAENPILTATYSKFKDKGFDILGVSFDKNHDNWLKAVENDQLKWNHVSDLNGWSNAAGKTYGIRSLPSNILIDPNGIIIARNLRGKDLENKLEEVLN